MANTEVITEESNLEDNSRMNKHGYHIMAEMPVWKAILKMAIPSVIMMLIAGGYMFADNVLAIQFAPDSYGGSKDVVRMGMSAFGPVNSLIIAFTLLFGMGISTRVSINLGAKRMKRAENTLRTGTMIGMAVTIILIPILLFSAKPWMGSQYDSTSAEQMIKMGYSYGWIIIMLMPFSFFNQILGGMFRTEGRNKAMMFPMVASIGVNLLFDWILMGPAGLGIEGGAWATFISTIMVTIIYVILIVRKKDSIVRLSNMFGWKFKAISIIGIVLVGISPFLRNFAQSITQTVEFNAIKDVSGHVYTQTGQVGDWILNSPKINGISMQFLQNMFMDPDVGKSIGSKNSDQIMGAISKYFDANGGSLGVQKDDFLFFSKNLITSMAFDGSIKDMLIPSNVNALVAHTAKAGPVYSSVATISELRGTVAQFASANQMTIILTGVFPIFALFFPTMFGFAQAARPISSFNFGAKRMDRVKQTFWWTILFATITAIIFYFIATFALNEPLMHALGVSFDRPHDTVSTAARATTVLRIMMLSMPMFGAVIASMVLTGSTDRIIHSILISTMRGVIFFFPSIYIFQAIANNNTGSEFLFWWFYPVIAAISTIVAFFISLHVLHNLNKKVITLDEKINNINKKFENRTWLKRKTR